jgi:hypothetical protein
MRAPAAGKKGLEFGFRMGKPFSERNRMSVDKSETNRFSALCATTVGTSPKEGFRKAIMWSSFSTVFLARAP